MLKMKYYFRFLILAGAIFGMFFGVGAGLSNLLHSAAVVQEENPEEQPTIKDGHRTNILVLGVDARPGEKRARSDTMMLVSIDPELNKVAVVSIPRDTRVAIKGGSQEKICAANIMGGPELAVSTVEKLMDLEIDNYVQMDFKGFKKIVDTLGGVTINVPQRMYKPSEDIDLRPGVQKLNGRQALGFVRYRGYVMGDIQRTAQQQEFIRALTDEILKPQTIIKLPKMARQIIQNINTDLTTVDMVKMASWAPGFSSNSVIAQTLPGYFYDKRDEYGNLMVSYWVADSKHITGLLEKMFAGQTVAVVTDSPPEAKSLTVRTSKQVSPTAEPESASERSTLPSPGHE